MRFIKEIVHLGLEKPYVNDFHSYKIKVANIVAIVAFTIFYFPQLTFHLNDRPTSMLSNLSIFGLFTCCLLILYFNYQKKHRVAKYILSIGFSISLLLTNLFYPYAKNLFAPYILVGLACGGLFESNRDKLISLSFCLLCLGIAVLHFLDILFIDFSLPVYSSSNELIFYRYVVVVIISFYVMHLTSSTVRKNEDLLKEQLNKIERLESQQKNYFSNTAHELKTPLTLISGHADFLMKNYGQDEKISKSLRNIKKNTHHLMDFTNQILNIIKAENSTIPVNVVQFYLRDFIFETLNNFDINAANKKISFQKPVYVPNIKIISDAQKLFIVLNNLLSNAFKYTQPNGLISVNVTEVEDAIQIIIQDDGIGIKEDDLERIFELYFQTSSVDVPLLGGTGIGLAICKQYIELLEGTIEVQSKWREGSTFTITFSKRLAIDNQTFVKPFKFDKVVDNPTPAENLSAKKKLTDAKQILIVEDNLELCDFFNTFLGQKFNLDFAHHGEEALAFLETQRPDLIMSDIMMPVMDGMKLLTRLKKDDHLSNIPVLMLTAKTDSFAQAKALRIGVDDYLLKPFDSDVLVAHIDNLLELADNRINNKHLEEETETDTEATVTIIEEPSYEATETAVVKEKKSVPIISREDKLWLAQFEELIGKSITDINLDLDKIANEMAISKTHLNRKVNSILGITPKRYIREVRLNKGKQMLEDREYDSVKAVAYSVGFRSDKVFSRNFKARFGKYPSEYLV